MFRKIYIFFLPLWLFITFFKIAASLHYTLMSPLGEQFFPVWLVGIIVGACAAIQAILDIPAGRWLDKFGYKRLLIVSNIIFIFASGILLLELNKYTYLISSALSIFGWLFFTPGVVAYILSSFSKKEGGRGVSLRDVFASIGVIISAFVLPLVLLDSYLLNFFIFTPFLISLLLLLLIKKEKRSILDVEHEIENKHFHIKRQRWSDLFKSFKQLNPASTMLLMSGISSSIFYAVIWFVVPLEIAKGVNGDLQGFYLAIFDFAIVAFGFLLGNLADKYNQKKMVFWGLLVFSVSSVLIGFNLNIFFLLFGFLATAGDEMSTLSLWSWLHRIDKNNNNGFISGVVTFSQDLGWAIGPVIAGVLYSFIGPSFAIFIGGLFVLVNFIFFNFWIKYHISDSSVLGVGVKIPKKPHFKRYKH